MMLPSVPLLGTLLLCASLRRSEAGAMSKDTLIDFKSAKVQTELEHLVNAAKSCTMRVRATPQDVRAYFTNSAPLATSGRCFAACMLESSGVLRAGQIHREVLIGLASLVNGPDSRVVRKLGPVSERCLETINGVSGRCMVASVYNDCLNEHMTEFSFPLDIAEQAVRRMPFRLIHANLPTELQLHAY